MGELYYTALTAPMLFCGITDQQKSLKFSGNHIFANIGVRRSVTSPMVQ